MTDNYPNMGTAADAYEFLRRIDAPAQLIRHVTLVGEAADLLIRKLEEAGVTLNRDFVLVGVVLHDIGKVLFPEELDIKGDRHELAGQEFLVRRGVPSNVARCCVSHGQWKLMDCSFEELLIALADTLWKGKREPELEMKVIGGAAEMLKKQRWDIFVDMDSHFEHIASGGEDRLARSRECA